VSATVLPDAEKTARPEVPMMKSSVTCVLMAACLAAPAHEAAAAAPATWPVGAVNGAIGQGNAPQSTCEVSSGSSALTTGQNAYISLPGLEYFPPDYVSNGIEFIFFGSAELHFTSSTAGTLDFDYYTATVPLGVKLPPAPAIGFSNYKAVPQGNATLSLSLTMAIGGCGVHLQGIYHRA
jgi:hypothetical protein